MKRLIQTMLVVGAAASVAATLGAQTKVIPGETKTATATVEAIEASTRTLTLKGQDGNYVTLTVPQSVERFDAIKVGDTLKAKYYESIILRMKPPGEKATDSIGGGVTPTSGRNLPAGTLGAQRTITATITAIDPKVPSVTFSGPNNWQYTSRVEDKNALSKVKVGDRVDITWTEALLLSFDEVKK
jgi:Cu/Ag efflux protein CusF